MSWAFNEKNGDFALKNFVFSMAAKGKFGGNLGQSTEYHENW